MKCIYCLRDMPPGREHVIPDAFGTYGSNTLTLQCVCGECNTYFGQKLDQLLARDTPLKEFHGTHAGNYRERAVLKRD